MAAREMRICVVGSGGVGKSCVTIQFLKQKFAEYYDPTIEESYRKTVTVDGSEYNLEIVDTAGQEEFATFRDSSLSHGDGFLLVYAINSADRWKELQELHTKILRVKDADHCPMVVIGNKADLEDQRMVQRAEAKSWCDSVGCPYLETSAKTGQSVEDSFFEVVREVAKVAPPPRASTSQPVQKKKKGCTLL